MTRSVEHCGSVPAAHSIAQRLSACRADHFQHTSGVRHHHATGFGTMRVVLGAVALLGLFGCASQCGNEMISDVASPTGAWHAAVFERDCGATTGFSTQVSILPKGQRPTGSGNAFVADGNHGRAPASVAGGPAVVAHWLSDRQLELRYHPRVRIFRQAPALGGVTIRYVADSTVGRST